MNRKVKCSNCGRIIEFKSNQPANDIISVICLCYSWIEVELTNSPPKGTRKMREDTRSLQEGIIKIFQDIQQPMTIRQIFYQAVSRNLVPKDQDKGYKPIQRNVLNMRRTGQLPYFFVADRNRRRMKPTTHTSAKDALDYWMDFYKQDIWHNKNVRVEIWLEKDALSGIFSDITMEYDVPLFISRGFSSETFLYEAAQEIKEENKPTYIYFFSDWDKKGVEISDDAKNKFSKFGVDHLIHFERAALSSEQVKQYNLPTRPPKGNKDFGESTELDAMHPTDLQSLVFNCIWNHLTENDIRNIEIEERAQREHLGKLKEYLNV